MVTLSLTLGTGFQWTLMAVLLKGLAPTLVGVDLGMSSADITSTSSDIGPSHPSVSTHLSLNTWSVKSS